MIVIDAAAAAEFGSFWKGLETNLRIQRMNWCRERREGADMKMAQNNAASDHWTLDTRSDANPIPNIEILLQKHPALLLPFLIFHLALQIVTYPDFISNNFSLIATINQDAIFSQVQNVNILRPYIPDHLVV